jgi:hypothetical protein
MKTTRLGATALEISEVGFGGIPIIPLPQEEAVSLVRYCFDLGIRGCQVNCVTGIHTGTLSPNRMTN